MTGAAEALFGDRRPAGDDPAAAAGARILILDGAMGTQIQALGFGEDHFRGQRFAACECRLQGDNDLLTLTQPQAIEDIHFAYAMAGADILETNTFSSTSIAQADYGMGEAVYELNRDGARLARRAGLRARRIDGRRRFVAGALGPTNRTASMSPDVNNPGFRAVTFDELRLAYGEQLSGLIDGGADLILIETIFDTLNAKAAIFACEELFAAARPAPADHDLGHHHRPFRAHAVGPDADRVLAFGAPRPALRGRAQLRARRDGDAPASGRNRRRRRHADLRLSQRRPAQRIRPLRREPRGDGGRDRRIRPRRPRQHRRRLLRLDARPHPGDRRGGARRCAPRGPERCAADAPVRPRAVHPDPRHSLRQRRRAHQRHRLGAVPQADHRRRLCRRARRRARSGRGRRADPRRQHGRGPASIPSARWSSSSTSSPPSPTSRACR